MIIDVVNQLRGPFKDENAINTLKELAEHGRCSVPDYYIPDEQVWKDGQYLWSCTCTIRSWAIQETELALQRK